VTGFAERGSVRGRRVRLSHSLHKASHSAVLHLAARARGVRHWH
jgi:hypothetical protein